MAGDLLGSGDEAVGKDDRGQERDEGEKGVEGDSGRDDRDIILAGFLQTSLPTSFQLEFGTMPPSLSSDCLRTGSLSTFHLRKAKAPVASRFHNTTQLKISLSYI
jgi:hypothetical protein